MTDNDQGAAPVYAAFEHSFTDVWTGTDREFSFRFARPGKSHIQRMQREAVKNSGQAARNLLLAIVHPENREAFVAAIDEYPGLLTSLAGAVIKAVGVADLGN